MAYCEQRRAFLIVDLPETSTRSPRRRPGSRQQSTPKSKNAAIYFPRLSLPDPLNENRPRNVAASGTLAGVFARTDATRGVWKAPAGTDADLRGAPRW